MLNRNKTGLALIFWTGLDQVRWKLVFRTDFEKLSLDYRRQLKPGQFYTAIHLTIWAVQNGPGMLNRNKTGLALIFWTGLDQGRWKLVFRTDFEKLSLDYRRQIKPGQFCTAIHLTIWAVQNGPGMLNRNKTGLALIFWTGLDQVRWKLVFRTDFEKLSLDYRRQLKPGQFYTAIHLTIWAVQNGPGMLNRNKTGLALIFWTSLDQVRWKLVFRTDFEKLSLDYRRQIKPGQFCTTLLCRMVRPCRMVRASKIVFEREWGSCFGLFWTKLDTNSYLGPILKGTMANNHDNPNPDVSA